MLKNYTSSVPMARTVARIEEVLAHAGAENITKDYRATRLVALTFSIKLPNQQTVSVRLPANAQAVYDVLRRKVKRTLPGTIARLAEQADRTAWKLMQDWVEIQLSLIQMRQVDFLQVFLPYVWDGKQTFYEHLQTNNFKLLTQRSAAEAEESDDIPTRVYT